MSQPDPQQPPAAEPARAEEAHHQRPARRRRRRRKAGLWSLISVAALAAVSTLFLLSSLGTPISVPDWLRGRIVERINKQTTGLSVDVGQMVVVIEEGWTPRLALNRVTLRGPDQRVIATLSELGGTVAPRPLLSGKLQPSAIRLSGLQVNLRRDDSGSVGVQLGGIIEDAGAATGAEARDVKSIVALIDDVLTRPTMASLNRVRADNMTLRYEDARTGRAWTVDGGRVAARREAGVLQMRGDFTVLGARAYASTLEMSFSSQIGSTAAQLGFNFTDLPAGELALQSPALAWLGALDAPISGDLRAQMDDQGRLGPLEASLSIGKGALQPTPGTKPITFESAQSRFTYNPVKQTIVFRDFAIDSKWVSARAGGIAHLIGDDDGWPDELQAQLRVSDIIADPAEIYDTPVELDGATMNVRLRLEPFHLSIGQFALSDQGSHLVVKGELRGDYAGWDLALDGRMDHIGHSRLMQLWPETVVPNTRKWVAENVSAADLSNVQLALRSTPERAPDVFLGFEFAGLTTRFLKKMPLIQAASGKGQLLGKRFAITADDGWVVPQKGGRIDISGTSFVVPDIKIKDGPAEAHVRTKSSITAALSLMDNEPFRFLSKLDRPVTLADGRAQIAAELGFRLKKHLKIEDVNFNVAGTATDVRSDVLVPGRVLSAETMEVVVDDDGLKVSGDGRLGGVPFNGTYRTGLGGDTSGAHVEGTVTLGQAFADEFGIGLPPGSLGGSATGKISIDLKDGGAGSFVLGSDLAGLSLSLPQLNWSLPRSSRATLEVRGRLGEPPQIDQISLDAPGLRASGNVSLTAAGQLNQARFSRVAVGGWLNGPVTLIGRGKGAAPAIEMTGGTVDLRKVELGGQSNAGGGPVSLALERLIVSESISLSDFRAQLSMAKGIEGTFSGRLNGGAPIRGQIVTQQGGNAFRITADDAGGVLGSAGVLKQARGGEMELTLAPAGPAGTYEGQLKGQNIWLKDAPALAALLSSLSVVGLLEQMSGNGIHFSDINARFRLGPERLTLYSGSAVGASMGISMDGYYYPGNKVMDMQGVVSPFYFVNAVGEGLTRKGEGVVGVNYTLTGLSSAPKVGVNPLSLLTPGFFREIFRRAPPRPPARVGGATPDR